jgi:peptidyl serine alpha-galactosyltransferase
MLSLGSVLLLIGVYFTFLSTGTTSASNVQYHIVFSTGCNHFMDWQSYVFFFHAAKVLRQAQPPFTTFSNTRITRIVSGCSETEQKNVQAFHAQQFQLYHPAFRLHFTPEFAKVDPINRRPYRYFNKPFGTQHWLEHAMGMDSNSSIYSSPYDKDIFILLDPDMILLKPFTYDFTQQPQRWSPRTTLPYWNQVSHGQPFAQQYGFGMDWCTKTNHRPTLSRKFSLEFLQEHFSVGPPYLATGYDFRRLVHQWAERVVPLHQQFPRLFLVEMYAYSLAAAALELPHQLAQSFIASDANDPAWEQFAALDHHNDDDAALCSPSAIPTKDLPNLLHYCKYKSLDSRDLGNHFSSHDP